MQLLRWDLPDTKLSFSTQDGSVEIENVACYLGDSVQAVKEAASASPGGKVRVIIFELRSLLKTETRIAALGGHGFRVNCPPGHRLIPAMASGVFTCTPLTHETAATEEIKKTNHLLTMGRKGGINFHPRVAGGYRPNADYDILIGDTQLNQALSEGMCFFENHFSGLIFGMGQWKNSLSWWDGVIPLRYLEFRPRFQGH